MPRPGVEFPGDLDIGLIVAALAVITLLVAFDAVRTWRRGLPRTRDDVVAAGAAAACTLLLVLTVAVPQLREPRALLAGSAVVCCVAVAVLHRQVYPYLGARRSACLLTLRGLAVAAILLALFRPTVQSASYSSVRPMVSVLVDGSESMSVRDSPNGPSRYDRAVEAWRRELADLADKLTADCFIFDTDVRPVDSPDALPDLAPSGRNTDLAAALRAAPRHDAPVLGVCLLTDGNHNHGDNPVAAAEELPWPVFAIAVGSNLEQSVPDVAVTAVDAPPETAVGNLCQIEARITAHGLANRAVAVRLTRGEVELAREQLVLGGSTEEHLVALAFTPTTVGRESLTVSVEPDPAEPITHNNDHSFSLQVVDPMVKVLYLEGRLRPEFKFLRDYLSGDAGIELLTVEQRQAGVWTLGGSVAGERPTQWPTDVQAFAEFIRRFEVIIIGDVHAVQLTGGRMSSIRDAVRDGSALLAIGGQRCLGPGLYADTPIEEALPVSVGGETLPDGGARQYTKPFLPTLTAEGRGHPIFRGLTEAFQADQSNALPALRGCVIVDQAKPGAAVLATVPPQPDQAPAPIVLAVQNFGAGRSAVFTADTTSQWCLARKLLDEPVYHRFWGQMVRWLAKVDPSERHGPAVQIRMGRTSYPFGRNIEVAAIVRDELGQLVDRAQVSATIAGQDGDSRHIPMPRSADRSGHYACTCPPPQPGRYSLSVEATKDGKSLGSDELDLFVEPPGDEMQALSLNQALLEQIALASGGRYAALPDLGRVLRGLLDGHAERFAAMHPRWSFNLFDHPFALLVGFAVLVTCEWLLRRRWQLQ